MLAPALFGLDFGWFQHAVEAATGWGGIFLIIVYSFLIAFALPLPSEVVLIPVCTGAAVCTGTLQLGLPQPVELAVVIVASGAGKSLGSVIALTVGHGASHSGPVVNTLRRMGYDPVEWSKQRVVELVRKWGYAGLAVGLTVPGFPDTLSIYAFSVIEKNELKFAVATFAGSVGRLVVTVVFLRGFTAAV
ncbi:YqaA family protein [Salarchaeum japonicum]|uniref:YqaA family protein n=1 Tax=Salarchaeum japonicum TaxID=555573 RepID=UPI003C720AD1